MGLNISSNFAAIANGAVSAMKASQTLMGKSITRISSGTKFSSHDDPVSLISANKIKADSNGYQALYNGIQNASARLSVANAATDSMLEILTTMKAKAGEYANLDSTNDGSEQAAMMSEWASYIQAFEAAKAIKYKGAELLNGSTVSFYLDIEAQQSIEITMVDSAISVSANDISAASQIQSYIDSLTTSIAGMNAGTGALELMSTYMSQVAAANETAYEAIADTDMAAEMTRYVKNNVQSQAAQAMVAQANQSLAQVLNLLQ